MLCAFFTWHDICDCNFKRNCWSWRPKIHLFCNFTSQQRGLRATQWTQTRTWVTVTESSSDLSLLLPCGWPQLLRLVSNKQISVWNHADCIFEWGRATEKKNTNLLSTQSIFSLDPLSVYSNVKIKKKIIKYFCTKLLCPVTFPLMSLIKFHFIFVCWIESCWILILLPSVNAPPH